MAAEKLTRGRIAQILIMMVVLITAFWWRTFEHSASQKTNVSCNINTSCDIHESLTNVQLDIENTQLMMQNIPAEWTVTSPLTIGRENGQILINLEDLTTSKISIDLKNEDLAQDIQLTIDLD